MQYPEEAFGLTFEDFSQRYYEPMHAQFVNMMSPDEDHESREARQGL